MYTSGSGMMMSPRKFDIVSILPLGASVMMIGQAPKAQSIAPAWSELVQAASLGGATLVLAFLVISTTALERRCSEEYVFQVMANAALVGLGTATLLTLIWLIAMKYYAIPELTGTNTLGIAILAWLLSYYWYRLRGLAQ